MADSGFDIETDLQPIRIEQARAIKANAKRSAFIVEISVITYAILIAASVSIMTGIVWFFAANFMVFVTLIYAKFQAANGITKDNYKAYLLGHIFICALTGMVWGGFAIYIFDLNRPFAFLVAVTLPSILTVGGMLPSSVYRPGYIALAIFALLPLGFYLTLTLTGTSRIFGLGIILFFGMGMLASAQAELNTRDGIMARRAKVFSKKLYEKSLEVERANAEKSQFLASTTHDFSQPLHAQAYYIEALAKQLKTAEQKQILDKIRGAWTAQKDLLEGLAEVTRLDSGAIVTKVSPFEITPVVEQIISELMPDAVAKDLNIESQLDNEIVFSDPALLARIIRNILHNAIKFTDKNGTVKISSEAQDKYVHLSITDTGEGLSLEDQERVFQAYYQSPGNRLASGSGLGLAIVKRLCDLLGIEFSLKSEKGSGTCFSLKLPISSDKVPAPDLSKTEELTFHNNPFVVLVDDNDDIRDSMLAALTRWGLKVIAAQNGLEAIQSLSKMGEAPALLIVDKRLEHNEDGIETISALRNALSQETAAILMTGDVAGFHDISEEDNIQILLKPVMPPDLKRLIWKSLPT
jgi:signal transduction histidine kinase/CheY-like chemotaxis protein